VRISGNEIKIALMPGLIIKDFVAKAYKLKVDIPNGSVKIHKLVHSGHYRTLTA
jgi:hypothetical protein